MYEDMWDKSVEFIRTDWAQIKIKESIRLDRIIEVFSNAPKELLILLHFSKTDRIWTYATI